MKTIGPFSKRRKRGLTSLLHDITSERKQQLDSHRNATQSPSTLNLLQNEFLMYDQIKEQSADTEDPLAWWRENESRFPLLSKIAKKYLCIAATSVASERVFSTSGYIVNPRRNKLKAENVDMFTFLAKNLQ